MSKMAEAYYDNCKCYRLNKDIFVYRLSTEQFVVYSYLVCCSGDDMMCWPSTKTIAERCGLCKNTVRRAIDVLAERKFIRKVSTERQDADGHTIHGNNHYYILELPDLVDALKVPQG